MELLLGVGVIALLVIGIGRWVRPNPPKPPTSTDASAPASASASATTTAPAPAEQPAATTDGGAVTATPVAHSTDVQTQGPGGGAGSSWAEARRLRSLLLSRQVPPTLAAWQIVPEEGEVFFYDLVADYERFYGQSAAYKPATGFYFGSPAFILAGLAVAGISNAQRRRAAEAASASQWRELERIRFVVTNHRLLCLVHGQWVSFHYAAMTAVYPEVSSGALVAEFTGVPPLRLLGPDVPIASVMTVFATHGLDAVASHPSLQVLG